jgi:cystathionine beta-lyase/cystathionine gamma-synthase
MSGRVETLRTRLARAGEYAAGGMPKVEPIHQNAVYAFADTDAVDRAFAAGEPLYARDGLPNARTLERAVAGLEGAEEALAVSSGMAAIAMTMLTLLRAGDHLIIGDCGYCDTAALLADLSDRFGIRVSRVDLSDRAAVAAAIIPATRLIYAETISNPGLILADLPMLAEIAHDAGVLLVVDNTFATPALCRPLEYGADCVLHSAGKFLGGHSDVTAGVIAGSAGLIARIRRSVYLYGPVLAPMDAWLTLRGLKTLMPRMAWASRSAAAIAVWLGTRPEVATVRYPGLPVTWLADCLLPHGGGAVLSFTMRDGPVAARRLIARLAHIPYVASIGGTTTIVSFPPRAPQFSRDGAPIVEPYRSATIRLSVGLEDVNDLIADFDQAFAGLGQMHSEERG